MNKGYMFGDYVALHNEHSKEEIKEAREKVVEDLCNAIRRIADECPEDFFIEKDIEGLHTIGAKLVVPYMPSEPKKEKGRKKLWN